MLLLFQVTLQNGAVVAWSRWKYPLTLTLCFLLIYGFIGILDPTPSVNLPEYIRLLLNDRLHLQLPAFISTNVSVIVEHKIQAVVASEVWYHAEDANVEENVRSLETEQAKNKPDVSQIQDRSRIEHTASSYTSDDDKMDSKKFNRWLQHREIIGNEHFVNRFQNRIQKPEDFYERNKDTVVKIRRSEHITTTTTKIPSSDADDLNTQKPERNGGVTWSSLLTTRLTPSVTRKYDRSQIYTNSRNSTLLRKSNLSNISTDARNLTKKRPRTLAFSDRADLFREVSGTTEPTPASDQLAKDSRNGDVLSSADSSRSGRTRQRRRKSRVNGTTLADLESSPYPPLIVNATVAFLDRVRAYNKAIATLGDEILRRRGYRPWRDVAAPADLDVVWGNTDDFLERLSRRPAVKTVILPWTEQLDRSAGSPWSSLDDRSNVLVNEYFEWSSTAPLCAWITTPGFTRAHWDAVYDRQCNEDVTAAARPRSLEFMYLRAKPINVNHYWPNYGTAYPAYFYTHPPPHVFYVHLLQVRLNAKPYVRIK